MARKDTLIARNVNFTATRREWVLGTLPSTVQAIGVTLGRSGWDDPTALITVGLETSVDGETWVPFCSVTTSGTPSKNPNNTPTVASLIIVSNPPANVFVKGYAKTNGATVRLALSLVELT